MLVDTIYYSNFYYGLQTSLYIIETKPTSRRGKWFLHYLIAAHRLEDFTAVVSDRAPNTVTSGKSLHGADFKLCKKYPGIPPAGEEVKMTCAGKASGRYVYIFIPHLDYLSFCDVKVYGEEGTLKDGVFDSYIFQNV